MKIIICLVIAIVGALWFFHARSSRLAAPPPLLNAATEAAVQAKTAIADAHAGAAEIIRAQPVKPETRALDRIVAGEKLREQPAANTPTPRNPTGSAAYDLILRGERIVENKRPSAQ